MKKGIAFPVILSIILVPVLWWVAASAQMPTFVANPDFEDGFREVGCGEVVIADEWHPWWDESKTRPEYKPEMWDIGSGRVYHGEFAQKAFTVYAPHDAGVYQKISAQEDQWYEFSIWLYIWSSGEDNPDVSVKDGDYRGLVGINPWGDCRALYRTTVWGKETYHVYNEWAQVKVVAQAWNDEVCLFVRGVALWGAKHNDIYIDSASLRQIDIDAPSIPTPCPSDCPSIGEIRQTVRDELDKTRLGH